MKNVFAGNKSKESETPNVPKQFREAAASFVHILRKNLSENEIRALAADKVASPVLQVGPSAPLIWIVALLFTLHVTSS